MKNLEKKILKEKLKPIYIIIGQTASGKTDLSLKLAKKINGEIISCDSRQIYKNLNIGSGKILKSEMKNIKHYCLDIVDTKSFAKTFLKNKQLYPASKFLIFAEKAILEIYKKNKTPILCGGTGLYLDAILYGFSKKAPLNKKLRTELEKENLENLLLRIKNLNLEKYYELINNKNPSEKNNKRRLIRIIENLEYLKNKTEINQDKIKKKYENTIETKNKEEEKEKEIKKEENRKLKYLPKFIFIKKEKAELKNRIEKRLLERMNLIENKKYIKKEIKIENKKIEILNNKNSLKKTINTINNKYIFKNKKRTFKNDLIKEVEYLRNKLKINDEFLISLGLEYKYITLYLQNKFSLDEIVEILKTKISQYAKRQNTWNKKYFNLEKPVDYF